MSETGLARGRGPSPSVRSLAGQAAWNTLALLLQLAGSFALLALAFRSLPAADVGAYSVVAVTVGLIQIIDPSAGYVMTREAARRDWSDPETGRLLGELRAGLALIALAVAATAITLATLTAVAEPGLRRFVTMTAGILLGASVQLATAHWPAEAVARGGYRIVCAANGVSAFAALGVAWMLLPRLGLAALGCAALAGPALGRATFLLSPARSSPPGKPSRSGLRTLWRHTRALYVASLAAMLLAVSDLWTVGLLRGATATAAYRAGSMAPTQASALFYRTYDVLYPRLAGVTREAAQRRVVDASTRVFSALAGVLFVLLWFEREPITRLIVGQPDRLTEQVFTVFCAIWLVNVPIHGLALLLISRGQPAVLTRVALAEAALNIVLSVILVLALGPIGAALGTLVTMAGSNLLVMPAVAERVHVGARRMVAHGSAWCMLGATMCWVVEWEVSRSMAGAFGVAAELLAAAVVCVVALFLSAGADGRRLVVHRV